MKLINKTRYSSTVLRELFQTCMAKVRHDYVLDWEKVRGLKVTVTYAKKKNFVSGYAFYDRPRMRLSIPYDWVPRIDCDRVGYRSGDISQAIAATFIHELGHNLGIRRHIPDPSMKRQWACCTIEHKFKDWIYDTFSHDKFPITAQLEEKPKADVRLLRFERALSNLERAKTRAKRAQTILKKWVKAVRYYEKTLPQDAIASCQHRKRKHYA